MFFKKAVPEKIEDLKRQSMKKEGQPVRQKKVNKKGGKAIIIALFLVALGILVFCFRDSLNFYSFKKLFSVFDVGNYGSHSAESIPLSYDSALSPLFVASDEGIIVASGNRITIQNYKGAQIYDEMTTLKSPAAASAGSYTLVYDRGGRELRLLKSGKLCYKAATDKEIISADVNEKGQLALVTEADGYRADVIITDEKQRDTFKWHSAERYISAAVIGASGKDFVAVSLGTETGDVSSRLSFYNTEKDEALCYTDMPGELICDVVYKNNGTLTAITDSSLYSFTKSGKLISKYSYKGRVLQYFSITADDHSVLVLNNHVFGTDTSLVVLDNDLKVVSDAQIGSEIKGISVDARRILLTVGDSLFVYNSYGDKLDTVAMPRGTRQLIQNSKMGAFAVQIDKAVPVTIK